MNLWFLLLLLLSGTIFGDEGSCITPDCCEEDCCGLGTFYFVETGGCIPDANSSGWNGTYSDFYQGGCVVRQCCDESCCVEGTVYNSTDRRCRGDHLFAFNESFVVIGVQVAEFEATGLCLPTTDFAHVITSGTPISETGVSCDSSSSNSLVASCQSNASPLINRFELQQVPTQIFNQHIVIPGLATPVPPPLLSNCFLQYNVRFSVECGPAKLQAPASSPNQCFNDVDGTVVCPVARPCSLGCNNFIDHTVDVMQSEAVAPCDSTPLRPGVAS